MQQAIDGTRASGLTIRFLSSVAILAALAACQPGSGGDATRASPSGAGSQLIEQDVEAPEVFEAQDRALWDGRPSLGGIWVAAPGVRQPERVILRNPENGKFVVGALFKRERDNPGPALQLSSEAAQALGIIAGAPTEISVVALRREEIEEPAPVLAAEVAEPVLEDTAAEVAAAPEAAEAAGGAEAIATAEAALDALETTGEAALDGAEVAATTPEAEAPKRGGFFRRLFSGPGRQAQTETPEEAAPVLEGALDATATEPVASSAEAPSIAATSLDAAATEAPESLPTTEVAALAPEVTIIEPRPDGTRLKKPFVEIGLYDDEASANEAARVLSDEGIIATVRAQTGAAVPTWRVFVGPTLARRDRTSVMRKARSLGFDDATIVEG